MPLEKVRRALTAQFWCFERFREIEYHINAAYGAIEWTDVTWSNEQKCEKHIKISKKMWKMLHKLKSAW